MKFAEDRATTIMKQFENAAELTGTQAMGGAGLVTGRGVSAKHLFIPANNNEILKLINLKI